MRPVEASIISNHAHRAFGNTSLLQLLQPPLLLRCSNPLQTLHPLIERHERLTRTWIQDSCAWLYYQMIPIRSRWYVNRTVTYLGAHTIRMLVEFPLDELDPSIESINV